MRLIIDRKNIYVIVFSISFAAFFVAITAVSIPFTGSIKRVQEEKNAYALEAQLLKSLLATKHNTGIVSQLVTKDKLTAITAAINNIADKNGIILTSLGPSTVGKDKTQVYRQVILNFEAIGPYSSLGQFLSLVRNMPEGIIDVKSLNVVEQKGIPDKVTARITFILFMAKDNG